jgi:hypothetical protein
MIKITRGCPQCKKLNEIEVDAKEYNEFLKGNQLIQDAMPTTPVHVREQLMTGIDQQCWNGMWTEEEVD